MFVGKSIHTLSKDGRISIPSKMREILVSRFGSEELYMVLLPSDILCLFPVDEFNKLTEKLEKMSENNIDEIVGGLQRSAVICSDAIHCKIDSSGRISIPPDMSKAAQIKKEVMVIGAKNHIQLWDPEIWFKERRRLERVLF